MDRARITIEFEISSDAHMLLPQLENQGILDDLALRSVHEFVRDLKKLNGFKYAKTNVELLTASMGG